MYIIEPRHTEEGQSLPFGFVCHPKTGSQSVRVALRGLKPREAMGHHYADPEECDRIRSEGGIVACTIRNPYDVMVSWYFYSHVRPTQNWNKLNPKEPPRQVQDYGYWLPRILESGNNWIEKGLFYMAHHANRILRFEHNLQTQMDQLMKDVGLPSVELGNLGATNHLHYRSYYGVREAIMIERAFPRELAQWRYTW